MERKERIKKSESAEDMLESKSVIARFTEKS